MNTTLQIFEHNDFGKIRTVIIDSEPWFVARDVTQALGYKNSPDALKKHVDTEDKRVLQKSRNATFDIPTRGLAIINEPGLYCLALSSKLPQAKNFRRWVTSIVIPSIRKHGAYATPDTLDSMMGSPQFTEALMDALMEENEKYVELRGKYDAVSEKNTALIRANDALAKGIGMLGDDVCELEGKVEILSPKAHYCDIVLFSGDAMPISVISKDYGMTAMSMNSLLHDLGIQYKVGGCWVLYQAFAGKGYMRTRTYHKPSGEAIVHSYWTQRGRRFLYNALALLGILPLAELEEMAQEPDAAKRGFCECRD